MAKVDVLSLKKEKVGQIELSDDIFGLEPKMAVLHEVVRWQLASRRAGTHKTKTRAFVSGGGKKPFKQKGTGNARQGSNRSPLMPGGAKLFGPVPRDYSYALPKNIRRLGLKMALSKLLKEEKLQVVEKFEFSGKTKEFATTLAKFSSKKAFIIDGSREDLTHRASRNLQAYKYVGVEGINVYDLLKYDYVVLSKSAVDGIQKRLQKVDTGA